MKKLTVITVMILAVGVSTLGLTYAAAQCADQYPLGKPYILYRGSNQNCPFSDWGLVNYFQHIIPFPAESKHRILCDSKLKWCNGMH